MTNIPKNPYTKYSKKFEQLYKESVVDDSFFDGQSIIPSNFLHNPSHINVSEKDIPKLLDIAVEQDCIVIDENTLYLHSLSPINESNTSHPFHSLIFQKGGIILKSKETTTEIIKRFFKRYKCSYDLVKDIGKTVDVHSKCPYVIGNYALAPIQGSSKKNVSWIAFHHVYFLKELAAEESLIKFADNHEIRLELSIIHLNNMFNRVCKLHLIEHQMFMDWQQAFTETKDPNNLISRSLREVRYHGSINHPKLFLHRYRIINILKIFLKALGEGHPDIDVIKEKALRLIDFDNPETF